MHNNRDKHRKLLISCFFDIQNAVYNGHDFILLCDSKSENYPTKSRIIDKMLVQTTQIKFPTIFF